VEMGNGEWEMGNGKWGMGNGILLFRKHNKAGTGFGLCRHHFYSPVIWLSLFFSTI